MRIVRIVRIVGIVRIMRIMRIVRIVRIVRIASRDTYRSAYRRVKIDDGNLILITKLVQQRVCPLGTRHGPLRLLYRTTPTGRTGGRREGRTTGRPMGKVTAIQSIAYFLNAL